MHELVATIPENDIRLYQAYAIRHRLPHRRLELLLAQVSQMVDMHMGHLESSSVLDYLLEPRYQTPAEEMTEEQAAAASEQVAEILGFNPRKNPRNRDNIDGQQPG